MNIYEYWRDVLAQDVDQIRNYFDKDAFINWHCTNEHFNVEEFIIANCDYPGEWDGDVERVEYVNDKIRSLDEYWADDGTAPQWRLEKHIGQVIQ